VSLSARALRRQPTARQAITRAPIRMPALVGATPPGG
jgi:hypothetical protein